MKIVCIFWLCLIINLTYGRRIGFNSTNESDLISPTWEDFQIRHIVSSDQGSAANWNAFFRRRMPEEYGKKRVNTFVVNSDSSIAKNFPLGVPQYNGGSASNLYWSSTKQHLFVLTLSGDPGQPSPNYNVYDCGEKYYVAALNMTSRLPVHYQGHSTTQGPRIDPIIAGCTTVTRRYFFCQIGETINGSDRDCTVIIVSGFLLGLVIVLSVVAIINFKKFRGWGNNAAVNEQSPLIG